MEFAMSTVAQTRSNRAFQIQFTSLFSEGRAFAFPCDEQGHVVMDSLSERARKNYLFARAMVGRDYAVPRVCPFSGAAAGGD
jgi:hypothetical protein